MDMEKRQPHSPFGHTQIFIFVMRSVMSLVNIVVLNLDMTAKAVHDDMSVSW